MGRTGSERLRQQTPMARSGSVVGGILRQNPTRCAPISGAEKSHLIEFYHECVKRPNFTEVGLNHSPPGAYLLAFDRGITRCGSFYQVSHSLRRSASWGLFQL